MVLTILLVKGHILNTADRKVLTSETCACAVMAGLSLHGLPTKSGHKMPVK